jgi:hypothetical protein
MAKRDLPASLIFDRANTDKAGPFAYEVFGAER